MAGLMSLVEGAAALAGLAVAITEAAHEGLEAAAQIVEDEAKRVIGTYDYDWPQLAESTQQQRVQLGFSANEPGLRTGEMRDSIGHVADVNEAIVGSNDDHLVWFELGTTRGQPPRPVLMGAAMHKENEVVAILGRGAVDKALKLR